MSPTTTRSWGGWDFVFLGPALKSDAYIAVCCIPLCWMYLLIIPVLLTFNCLWSQQQKGPDSCILSEAVFLYSSLPTLNSELFHVGFKYMEAVLRKARFFFKIITLCVNVCVYFCVWDEPLSVTYLQAKKELLFFCLCVFGKPCLGFFKHSVISNCIILFSFLPSVSPRPEIINVLD